MSKRFSLGRADVGRADILLPGSTISAKHAEMHIDDNGALLVSDMGSSNGTTVIRNGKKLKVSSQLLSLESSDILSLGGKNFTIAELLAKLPGSSSAHSSPVPDPPADFTGKMMRCSACGSVTPEGKACVECGYYG